MPNTLEEFTQRALDVITRTSSTHELARIRAAQEQDNNNLTRRTIDFLPVRAAGSSRRHDTFVYSYSTISEIDRRKWYANVSSPHYIDGVAAAGSRDMRSG
ncbi:hypothetical protein MRX96_042704 [Rhipicephalus microplus]